MLKTYDPASGVALKYKTSKAAEVTRLVQMLGQLGKRMAGVAVPDGDEVMVDAPAAEAAEGRAETPVVPVVAAAGSVPAAAGGGKGKKKKGKR